MANYSSILRSDATSISGFTSQVNVYSTINDLPLSGVATGLRAYVTGNNRYYFYNGTGWSSIGIANTSPSLTDSGTPESTYALAIDGSTPTIITIIATDPEELPITYSVVADSDFSGLASVSQDSNVFTITPFSSDSATTTSGTLTFKASDGVNIATASSTFTLTFEIANSNYTTLLAKASGNSGTNTSVTDSSSNAHTMTVSGDVRTTSFSPYRSGGYSYYLNGSSYVRPTNKHSVTTGNWTMEFWAYMPDLNTSNTYAIAEFQVNNSSAFEVLMPNLDGLALKATSVGTTFDSRTSGGNPTAYPPVREWFHIAITYNGSYVKLYLNGAELLSVANSSLDVTNTHLNVGACLRGTDFYFTGYISDFRLVKDVVYNGNFIPPTERLTTITNTDRLLASLPYLGDASDSTEPLIASGSPTIEAFAPYNYSPYSASSHGGSVYFDGSGDYLTVTYNSNLDLTQASTHTIEAWVYLTSTPSANTSIITTRPSSGPYGYDVRVNTSRQIQYYHTGAGSVTGSVAMVLNTWNHVAVVLTGGTAYIYINGILDTSGSFSSGFATTQSPYIGRSGTSVAYLPGYIADLRVVNGTAVYTAAFTPPTSPLTAITNTALLMSGQDAKVYDASQTVGALTLAGNATSSTTQTKYASSSVALDGTGDYISVDKTIGHFGTSNFTIEGWWYFNTVSAGYQPIITLGQDADQRGWGLITETDNELAFYMSNGSAWSYNIASTTVPNLNAWNHIAVTRSGGTLTLFLNGTSIGTASIGANSTHTTTSGALYIGHYPFFPGGARSFNGYIEDVRITKSLSRYPFIPTKETLTAVSGTSILTAHTSSLTDGSSNSHTITTNGSMASPTSFAPSSGMYSQYFDGSDDYITTSSDTSFGLGTADFTFECWYYWPSGSTYAWLMDMRDVGTSYIQTKPALYSTTSNLIYYVDGGDFISAPVLPTNKWVHVALVRASSVTRIFVDGSIVASGNDTKDYGSSASFKFGRNENTYYGTGYASNIRLVKGTALYSEDFTPPTSQLNG